MGGDPLAGLGAGIDGTIDIFADPGNTRVILFTLVIGSLIAVVEHSGGVRGLVRWLETHRWVNNARRAQLLAWMMGVVVFIESNITLMVAGTVSRPLFDRFRISREKLAYLIDSTSAPICILIPLNAWGAFNIGLLSSTGVDNALEVFVHSIPLNLYPITAVLLAGVSVFIPAEFGPMAKAQARTEAGNLLWPGATPMMDQALLAQETDKRATPRASAMALPIIAMIVAMPVSLMITGNGNLIRGSGSTSVLWSVLIGLGTAWILALVRRTHSADELTRISLQGAGGLVPVAAILMFAMALGDVTKSLDAGLYIAGFIHDTLPLYLLLPGIFLASALIAFSTGTSWGTFAIMIPMAVPIAIALEMPPAPFLAAVLSGAVFGDHTSPISDTTIVASMASATDHIDHVRTQLPYALLGGAVSLLGFAIMGVWL
ncbi:Na+/H+ antiporter NhaC family protein [Pseudomaricurvus alkylphenolicus]|uniref:Na+/H+ antiporter NhaC family protein n=1 Tax=Pseudomaricurvus alkylphenolicus TaxID=1306991 RepID=UPI001F0DDA7D|nr:Na+/H+ antiporter NhaC family protein [Pseudomaricurvus alkylphenolicus]